MMKPYAIGMYEKAVPEEYTIPQMLALASETGYDFFEISIDRTDMRIARLTDAGFIAETKEAIAKTGIPIGSICLSALGTYCLGDPDDSVRERAKQIFRDAVDFSADLGVRILQIPGCDTPKFAPRDASTNQRFLEALRELIPYAALRGVLVGIENMENNYMDTVTKSMQPIDYVNSPYLQLYPDAGNIYAAARLIVQGEKYGAGDNEAPELTAEEKAKILQLVDEDMYTGEGHYVAFHLKETRPNRYGGIAYGEGHTDFARTLENAWNLGARRFVMEYWYTGSEGWKEDLVRARELCEGLCEQRLLAR